MEKFQANQTGRHKKLKSLKKEIVVEKKQIFSREYRGRAHGKEILLKIFVFVGNHKVSGALDRFFIGNRKSLEALDQPPAPKPYDFQ